MHKRMFPSIQERLYAYSGLLNSIARIVGTLCSDPVSGNGDVDRGGPADLRHNHKLHNVFPRRARILRFGVYNGRKYCILLIVWWHDLWRIEADHYELGLYSIPRSYLLLNSLDGFHLRPIAWTYLHVCCQIVPPYRGARNCNLFKNV